MPFFKNFLLILIFNVRSNDKSFGANQRLKFSTLNYLQGFALWPRIENWNKKRNFEKGHDFNPCEVCLFQYSFLTNIHVT